MARVFDSPTANLFSLLAEDIDRPQRKERAAAKKGNAAELTPKERAEAKAVQEAERRAKREAELKAKQEQEAARKARALNDLVHDDTGFVQQRHQRIKESRVQDKTPEAPAKGKGDNKGPSNKGPKNNKGPKDVADKFAKGDKPVKTGGKPDGKGPRGEGKGKTFTDKPRGREFDKHSQGVVSRKPAAKKGGHGRGNWDNAQGGNVAPGSTAEEATTTVVAAKDSEADGWGDIPDATANAPAAEGEAKTETETETGAETAADNAEEEDKSITYEEFLALKAAKQKELEALVGAVVAQPRALSEDETKALAKFTVVENTKVAKQEAKPATSAAPVTRKKQPVVLEVNLTHPPREGARRGPRKDGQGGYRGNRDNRDNQNRGEKKTGGRVAKPAKLPRGGNFDTQFPSLG